MRKCSRIYAVTVFNHQSKFLIRTRILKKLAVDALRMIRKNTCLEIAVVNDVQIRKINKLYHGSDRATDVLAFESSKKIRVRDSKKQFFGEIIISVDRASVYAKRFHVSLDEELVRYMIHGILHLFGERDDTFLKRKKMFRRQEKILASLQPFPWMVAR